MLLLSPLVEFIFSDAFAVFADAFADFISSGKTIFGTGTNPFVQGSVSSTAVPATITAINAADASGITNTITVNIDSSAFTWLWPTSAVALTGIQTPFVEPVGEAAASPYQNLLDDATRNQSFSGVQIGTTVQTSGKTYQWFARSGIALS